MKFIIVLSVCLIATVLAEEPILGGWNAVSADDETVKLLAVEAVNHHNNVNNYAFYKKLVKIEEAQYQVVAGTNYKIKFLIGKTECAKKEAYTDSCQVIPNSPLELCNYVFYYPLGSQKAELTSFNCASVQ